MYSDAVKTVGADFEVAELTTLLEQALAEAGLAQPESRFVSSSATSNRSATAP